jgi:8-amino-7-oxononanoate synthase
MDGRPVVSFASNDYLGLAGDDRLVAALAAGAAAEGAGSGAARLMTGAREAHASLERDVASWKGCGAALLAGSGYALNVSLVPALAGKGDLVVSDALNHASLVDGCRLSRAKVVVVPHGDVAAVKLALHDHPSGRRVVITEGLHGMDGDLAPLADLATAAAAGDALLVVDDSHGQGVLGPDGRGLAAAVGVATGPGLVEVGTFGKAFGGFGAFVAWTPEGIEHLVHTLRGFVFSTSLPPGVAAADAEGLRLSRVEAWRRDAVLALAARFRAGLRDAGGPDLRGEGPIVSVVLGDVARALETADSLLKRGWWIPAVRPPTVPVGTARLRVSFSAAHTADEVDRLAVDVAALLLDGTRG